MEIETFGFSKTEEYKSLRDELRESKRYVFERPLLAITAILAAAQFVDKHQLAFLPFVAISILTFNFWFTVNRLRSTSRIVAYIQVVLESRNQEDWVGWENFLRHQRMWLKMTKKEDVEKIIRENLDERAVPDALFYYPAIFNFHIVIVLISCLISVAFANNEPNITNLIALAATILIAVYFLTSSIRSRPSKMKSSIEEYRIISLQVLKYIKELDNRKAEETGAKSQSQTEDEKKLSV
jgi:hypothetical protein